MKSKTLRNIAISQIAILLLFLSLTLAIELFDLPHLIFHNTETLYSQRFGEIKIEFFVFCIILTIQIVILSKLLRQIKLLEGFIPICANCNKIRNDRDQWEAIEEYITQNSLAKFSHSICPDCCKKLYPGIDKL
jgi:hypothetical protein